MMKIFILIAIFILKFNDCSPACNPFDHPCEGAHGSQGNCCPGTYCHKPIADWAQGRCYNRDKGPTNVDCAGHDLPCEGLHGSSSNCCAGLYCHKSNPNWAQGVCYRLPVVPADYYTRETPAPIVTPAN